MTIIFTLLTIQLSGQSFAPVGAKWIYSYYGWSGPMYTVISADSMVTFQGKNCMQLNVVNKRMNNGVVEVNHKDPIFTYSNSDTVFIFYRNEFRPVYFFNVEKGDTLLFDNFQLPDYPATGCSSDTLLYQINCVMPHIFLIFP
ncbi:MAG: hypothetical protein WD048_13040 [Chitinophagales bacterium]